MVIFITGTDTGVGKTLVSSLLARGLEKTTDPAQVCYFKPVQTGPHKEDEKTVRSWAPHIQYASLYHYPTPCSPDQAAQAHPHLPKVSVPVITEKLQKLDRDYSYVLCEGAGGLYVPLNEEGDTWWDVLRSFPMKLILVTHSSLGTLNHTTLSLRAIEAHGQKTDVVIVNGPEHPENIASLQRMCSPQTFMELFPIKTAEDHEQTSEQVTADLLEVWERKEYLKKTRRGWAKKFDHSYTWHPFTQHKNQEPPLWVEGARGHSWTLEDGTELLDGISSWWVSGLGHGRKELARVLSYQQQKLDHVLYGGTAHEPAAFLARELVDITYNMHADKNSPRLQRVFYSDNGSTAVEVALKMAYSYSQRKRKLGSHPRFLALSGGYHGDTLGAMSVSAETRYHTPYEALFAPTEYLKPWLIPPHHNKEYSSLEEALDSMESLLAREHENYLALICEPLVQGAGGMLMQHPTWTHTLVRLCRKYGIPVIFDEVFTGYGRLGSPFAFQKLGITPDLLCTSKGLTSGTLPLAVTLSTEEIFSAFYSSRSEDAFLHGHTFTAHATACAVALKVLEIYKKNHLFSRATHLEQVYHKAIANLKTFPKQALHSRVLGSIWAFEVGSSPKKDSQNSYFAKTAQQIAHRAQNYGLFVRPLGRTLYLAPSLTISDEELLKMCSILGQATEEQKNTH